ncbi:MAG: 3-deoxy-D-manno-octulosonic acid transferase [Magnetovibrio sp.]|nr:3-deoxy-D-manno-octulosonic acid transferase [Magnetovibrio sp.]
MLTFYRLLTVLGEPFIRLYLICRLSQGKEPKYRFSERLGVSNILRPKGGLVWLHGASIGESLSMLPVIEQINKEFPSLNFLVTTGTVSSAEVVKTKLPVNAIHQFMPVDRPIGVERFLNYWRPDIALWWESEFWPNTLSQAKARGIPIVLMNGRISLRSYDFWKRCPLMIKEILSGFRICFTQTYVDAERLTCLGATKVECLGNLKLASPQLLVDEKEFSRVAEAFSLRPCWLAASTHPGEEEIIWHVHQLLEKKFTNLITTIIPRHPERGCRIAEDLNGQGASVLLRSKNGKISSSTQIYIADTLGEMGIFFRLSPVVFMGKSLTVKGGQNPIEPARFGCAILAGPHMENFTEIVDKLKEIDILSEVKDAHTLASAIEKNLDNPLFQKKAVNNAEKVASIEAEILERVMLRLRPFFEQVPNPVKSI